jgi:hypothetical protein
MTSVISRKLNDGGQCRGQSLLGALHQDSEEPQQLRGSTNRDLDDRICGCVSVRLSNIVSPFAMRVFSIPQPGLRPLGRIGRAPER